MHILGLHLQPKLFLFDAFIVQLIFLTLVHRFRPVNLHEVKK